MSRILSLDIGRNKTGVAISEELLGLVTPLKALVFKLDSSPETWFQALSQQLQRGSYDLSEIDTVVIGSWKDKEHKNLEMKRLVKKAISIIKDKTSWKVVLVNETYTSVESREILKEMGFKQKKISRSVDSYAASLLLIDYLELIRR